MHVVSAGDPPSFAQQVLRGIAAIQPPSHGEADLCLELGLSFWMRQTDTSLQDACPELLAVRTAIVEVSGMDLATEPVPLRGVDPRRDIVNLAAYLRWLLARATLHAQCDFAALVDRALLQLGTRRGNRVAMG
jgi:hypothetical protein